jgi:hypothetical protein
VGTTSHRGAHKCRALSSAGVCSELCCVPQLVAHRIERNPDWKVFLNMAAAAGALIHVRSAPQALTCAGGGRHDERQGRVRLHPQGEPALLATSQRLSWWPGSPPPPIDRSIYLSPPPPPPISR